MPEPVAPLPPPAVMMNLTLGGWFSQAITVAAELGVADELASGSRPVDELAKDIGADAPTLYRLLRALASIGLFTELDGRRFALTPLGDLVRSDVPGSMRSWAIFQGRPFHLDAWRHLGKCVREGEYAFDRQNDQTLFDYFQDHPEDAEVMNAAMTAVMAQFIPPIVESYDFSAFGTVVDVGGGHGHLLAAVLAANPGVRGVLFDLPHVVAGAGPLLERAGIEDRCERASGDFFAAVLPGGDAYLLSNIIHDWDDERSVAILANCRTAMNDGGRVLLAELVLPDTPGSAESPITLWADLEMLVMTSGGRQRTEAEFSRLLRRAGLRWSRIIAVGEGLCIVEAVAT